MAKAWLSLGANIGEPAAQVLEAIARLDARENIALTARSSIFITAPWGKTDQPDFANAAIEVETSLSPLDLLAVCLDVEKSLGRVRLERWGPRRIDIDIIAYDDLVLNTPALTLPHPFAHERAFVLDPLREIAPATADWLLSRAL